MVLFVRFQRAVRERGVPARLPEGTRGEGTHGTRPLAIHRTADAPGPESPPGESDAPGGRHQARGDRRITDRSGELSPGPRAGLFRRGTQGLQGTHGGAPDGSRRAEIQDVSVRPGPLLSWLFLPP